jgi:hypothetical protein
LGTNLEKLIPAKMKMKMLVLKYVIFLIFQICIS